MTNPLDVSQRLIDHQREVSREFSTLITQAHLFALDRKRPDPLVIERALVRIEALVAQTRADFEELQR